MWVKAMSNLSKTYANALFELSLEENIADEVLCQSKEIKELLLQNPEFIKLLDTPTIPKEEKVRVADKTFGDSVNKNLLNFMKVMIERKNANELLHSIDDFEVLYNKHYGIEKAVAITAVPMSEEMKNKLCEKLAKVTGEKIILTNKVDPSVIGGVVLEFSDKQYNDSIANKLSELKVRLKKI